MLMLRKQKPYGYLCAVIVLTRMLSHLQRVVIENQESESDVFPAGNGSLPVYEKSKRKPEMSIFVNRENHCQSSVSRKIVVVLAASIPETPQQSGIRH